ncbi:MAG: hypothetical protein WB764_10740 [Xanthobacteraceae bacterium]
MTSSVAKTLAIGSCAFVLLALAEMAQAQTASVAPRPVQLPPCDYDGQTVSVTLNTGTVLPVGLADPIWNVSPGFTAYSTTPATGWLANQATAKWVQPASGGTPVDFYPTTLNYVYTAKFTTPSHPYYYNSIMITGTFAGDDSAVLTLNGAATTNCPSTANNSTSCFHVGKAFTIAGYQNFTQTGTAPFVNTLTIQVNNSNSIYSGLLVKATLKAVCSKCTSPIPTCGGNPSTC